MHASMNFEVHDLQPIEVAVFQVKEVLKIIMHSIVFQRALGEYGLRDTESELFEVSYVRCNSRLIDLKVEEHADEFSKTFERYQWTDDKASVQAGVCRSEALVSLFKVPALIDPF